MMMEEFKQNLEVLLAREGRSQAYLARKIGYTPDQLNKWLLGQIRIPYSVVSKICVALPIDRLQQIELFEQAGYPLPKWVVDIATLPQTKATTASRSYSNVNPAIMGLYEGESRDYRPTDDGLEPIGEADTIEQFSIVDDIGIVEIAGSSFEKITRNLVSTWTGHIFKVEANTTLYFILELQQDRTEFGILTFHFQGCTAHGWYYSTRINTKVITGYQVKKVDSFGVN